MILCKLALLYAFFLCRHNTHSPHKQKPLLFGVARLLIRFGGKVFHVLGEFEHFPEVLHVHDVFIGPQISVDSAGM